MTPEDETVEMCDRTVHGRSLRLGQLLDPERAHSLERPV